MARKKEKSFFKSYIKHITPPYKATDILPIFLTFMVIALAAFILRPAMAQLDGDTESPQVKIYYPEDGSVNPIKVAVLIRANVTDNVAVAKVEFYINDVLKCTDTTIDQYGYTCDWDFPVHPGEKIVIKAKAYDQAGNLGSHSITVYTHERKPADPTPPPLNKRVFVTSAKYTGDIGGLSGADAKCQGRASAAKLGGTWKAWLSDSNVSAASRLNHSEVTYIRMDNKKVADNWADLTDGELWSAIQVDESGKTIAGRRLPNPEAQGAWTGTDYRGIIKTPNCSDWTSRSTQLEGIGGRIDHLTAWTSAWLTGGESPNAKCSNWNHLYCFEQ